MRETDRQTDRDRQRQRQRHTHMHREATETESREKEMSTYSLCLVLGMSVIAWSIACRASSHSPCHQRNTGIQVKNS